MTEKPSLDLTLHAWRQRHGDIEAFGTWFGERKRPCMVLLRRGDYGLGHQRIRPSVILLDNEIDPLSGEWRNGLWVYDEREGNYLEAQIRAQGIAEGLGLGAGLTATFRVLGIIRDHLEDMTRIPPRPPTDRRVVADFRMTERDTGIAMETEVTDDV